MEVTCDVSNTHTIAELSSTPPPKTLTFRSISVSSSDTSLGRDGNWSPFANPFFADLDAGAAAAAAGVLRLGAMMEVPTDEKERRAGRKVVGRACTAARCI